MSENRIEARLQGPVFLANDFDVDAASWGQIWLQRGCKNHRYYPKQNVTLAYVGKHHSFLKTSVIVARRSKK